MFPKTEVLQIFGYNDELTEIGKQGGTFIERGVMTPTSKIIL
jgi:hypothetical protein